MSKATTPLKAIKEKCLECCCGDRNEVKLCVCKNCPLYAFRFGKNSYLPKREMTEEQKQLARERLSQFNLSKNSQ